MLPDLITGERREVDVVISTSVAGHDLAIGIETRAHKRVQGVEWVEQAASKHERLPINQTVLVSRSGFTKTAQALAAKLGIELVTPDKEVSSSGPLAGLGVQVEAKEVSWSGDVRIKAWMVSLAGEQIQVDLAPGTRLFAEDGTTLGTALDFVRDLRGKFDETDGAALADEDAKWLVLEVEPFLARHPSTGHQTSVHLKYRQADVLGSAIERIQVAFSIDVRISQVELEFGGLQGVEFAAGTGDVNEHKALIVMTEGDAGPRTSVRITNRDGDSVDLSEHDVTRLQISGEQVRRMKSRREDTETRAPEDQ